MTKEQQFFLQVLADHLNKRETLTPDGLDWQQLYAYAKSHQVQGIFWSQCKGYLSSDAEQKEIKDELQLDAIKSTYLYYNNINAYKELQSIFKKNNVRFFPVKGLEIAALYPIPAFRTMGDIDIVAPEGERERIRDDMLEKGYVLTRDDYELIYNKQNICFEIHDHLVYEQNQEKTKIKQYFDECWKHICKDSKGNEVLDWNYHLIFLIQHTKKHFHGNGIGFRQFMDIAVTILGAPDLQWTMIETDLRKIGLWEFTLKALAFCHRWFDVQLPVQTPEIEESFYEESTEFVFKNGVFGRDNEHHQEHAIERQIRAAGMPKLIGKMKIICRDVFIPYNEMLELPYCSFVKDKKYLLPAAWIYRVYYVLRKKRNQFEDKRTLLFESEDIINRHRILMRKWGL